MEETLREFLTNSPMAGRVRPDAAVVVHRESMLPARLAAVTHGGESVELPRPGDSCELEVGGQVLATGSIVRRGGKHYFRAREVTA